MQNTKVTVKGSEKEKDERRVKGRKCVKEWESKKKKNTLNAGGLKLQECVWKGEQKGSSAVSGPQSFPPEAR